MSTGIERTTGTRVASRRQKLLERLRTVDGRGTVASADEKVVDKPVDGDFAPLRSTTRSVVRAEVFDDVVFDQGVSSPPINSEVAIAVEVVVARVVDRAG